MLTLTSLSNACLNTNNCAGITTATCTFPCYNCGFCLQSCCRKLLISRKIYFYIFCKFWFIERGITGFGRSETENRGHGGPGNFFGGNNVIPCIFGSGRNENSIEESEYRYIIIKCLGF